jgi:segregation and condensation protein B
VNLKAVLEGILFIVGDEGTTISEMVRVLGVNEEEVKNLLVELKKDYEDNNRGLRISYLGNAFKLTTKEEHRGFYEKLVTDNKTTNLSNAALEVLAVIAYNEPITRLEIDEIRGVNSSQMVRNLIAKGLIMNDGKSDLPGRPNLYKTTSEFLDYFGLATIEDLPEIKIDKDINDDTELFTSIYKEENE